MPEATSAGGGYTCQVCGTTYPSESELIQHGRELHPDRPVTWGDARETAVSTEAAEVKSDAQEGMEGMTDKMKAGVKAAGEKMTHPDKDLKSEYEKKKAEERAK
jgi:hypothetical protein